MINFLFVLQGDIDEARRDKDSKCVFITVHDIGSNHRSMVVSMQLPICQCIRSFF